MGILERLRAFDRLPIVMAMLVLLTPLVWLIWVWKLISAAVGPGPSLQVPNDVDEMLGLDTLFHLFALFVAVKYGLKNRRWAGVVLAVLSPLVFVFLFMSFIFGPSEPCDFWGTCPTTTTLVVASVVASVTANVALASGLILTARRE